MGVALDPKLERDFLGLFPPGGPMAFSEVFEKSSKVADHAEDVILTYKGVSGKGD